MSGDVTNLVRMANQIAEAFKASPQTEAVEGVATHIKSFWAPKLRQRLIDHAAAGHSGLLPLTIQAIDVLKRKDAVHQP
ncbi:MAG: formate dehydrogenase subunit delta [Hyphomicrobiaceae bacterium]